MSIFFGGGETASFSKFNAVEVTTGGTFVSPARCGIHTKKNGWINAKMSTPQNEIWLHFDLYIDTVTTGRTPIQVLNSSGTSVFSMASNGDIYVGITKIGNKNIFTQGFFTIDIHLLNSSSTLGVVEIYVDSQNVFNANGGFNFTNMNSVTLSPVGDTTSSDITNTIWSQCVIASDVTIGYKLATIVFSGMGSATDWSGSYTDINEVVLDNNTYINASSAGLVSTFTTSGISGSYTNVKAVIISSLAKYATVGPKNLDAIIRISSVNYSQPTTVLGLGYLPASGIFEINPATSLPWTNADVNGAEYGVRSKI